MRSVTLTRLGNTILLRPWKKGNDVCDELAEELTCERRVKSPLGYWETRTHEMFEVDSDDDGRYSMMTYGGFYQRIMRLMKRRRVKVKVIDKQKPLPEPDWSKLPALRPRQPEAIAAIAAAQRGIIKCPTAFGKSFVIKTLCALFPTLKIMVVTKLGRVTKNLYKKIDAELDEPVARLFGKKPTFPEDARVVVTTIKSMYKVKPNWPDMVFFDEAHNAGAYDASSALSTYMLPNLFGFSATPEGRGDNTDLVTEAFFGEHICDVEYQDARADGTVSQITAMFVMMDFPEIDTDGMSTMQKNKEGYWWNELRNRRLLNEADNQYRPEETVLYYVENTEHALYLRLLRPGLPVAHGGVSKQRWDQFLKRGLVTVEDEAELKKPDLDFLEAELMAGNIKRIICTSTWKEGVDFPDLAGLVRFDGGAADIGSEQIPGRLSRIGTDGKKTDALLIDAQDNFGRRYRDRSGRRRRVYEKNGWKIVKLWE